MMQLLEWLESGYSAAWSSAFDWGSKGREFKSLYPDHFFAEIPGIWAQTRVPVLFCPLLPILSQSGRFEAKMPHFCHIFASSPFWAINHSCFWGWIEGSWKIRPRQAIAEIIIGIDNRRSAVTLRIRFRSQPVQLIVSKRQIPVFAACAVFRDRGTHACRIDLIFMMSADLFLMLPYIQDEFTNRCSKYPNNQITEYCTS